MPVFDINAGLNIPQATTAQQDDLMEARTAALEKNVELADEELELKKQQGERADRRLEIDEEQAKRAQEEWDQIKDTRDGKILTDGFRVAHAAHTNAVASGKTEEEARTFAYNAMIDRIDQLLPGQRDEAIKSAEANGLTPESFDPVYINSMLGITPEQEDDTQILKEGDQLIDSEGNVIAENVKDFAPKGPTSSTPAAKPIPVPTRAEADIVEEFTEKVFESDKYDDYGFDDDTKESAKRWVGNTAERIQRINGQRGTATSYDDAVAAATLELDKFFLPPAEPGFFSNDAYSFVPPPYNIGDVIQGDDGAKYLVTGYNEKGGPRGEPVGN